MNLNESQLKHAYRAGRIAAIAVNNRQIVFCSRDGLHRGRITTASGGVKNYRCDSTAWQVVDHIKSVS